MSIVEKNILSRDFVYDPPWFYNNEFALRCELGIGDGKEYRKSAQRRAHEIYQILFEKGVDAFFFHDWIYDYDEDCRFTRLDIEHIIENEKHRLEFVLGYQRRFKHRVIRDIPFDKEDNEDLIRENRIVCYVNSKFNANVIIKKQLFGHEDPDISFVSCENECILTVYDHRGCDIVFYDKEKFKEFYPKLKPYFLPYDLELMEERLKNL